MSLVPAGLAQHLELTFAMLAVSSMKLPLWASHNSFTTKRHTLFESFKGLQCRFMLSMSSEPLSWIRQDVRLAGVSTRTASACTRQRSAQALKHVWRHRDAVKNIQIDMQFDDGGQVRIGGAQNEKGDASINWMTLQQPHCCQRQLQPLTCCRGNDDMGREKL